MNAFIPEVIANIVAIVIASGIVLVLYPPDAHSSAVLVVTVVLFTLLGGLGGDGLGDAIITCLIIVCLLVVFYFLVPLDGLVKQIPVSVLVGMVTGKLTLAVYADFLKPASYSTIQGSTIPSERDSIARRKTVPDERDSATQGHAVSDEHGSIIQGNVVSDEFDSITQGDTVPGEHDLIAKSNVVLREFDIVRVISLESEQRDYDGSDDICRAPKVGDEAIICHEYNPDDPTAAVAVEKLDYGGLTVWLADFEKSELALVYRPK